MVFIFLFIITFILIGSAIYYGIGPNQTPKKALRLILESLPNDVKTIYDLGSGFGITALYLAKKTPKATVIAIEASLIPFLISKIFSVFQKNMFVFWKNYQDICIKDADVIYCYLYRRAMKDLQTKFDQELKNGASVISYTFSLSKKEERTYDLGGFYQNKLYCYKYE